MSWLVFLAGIASAAAFCALSGRVRAGSSIVAWWKWLLLGLWYCWAAMGLSFVVLVAGQGHTRAAQMGLLVFILPAVVLAFPLLRTFGLLGPLGNRAGNTGTGKQIHGRA